MPATPIREAAREATEAIERPPRPIFRSLRGILRAILCRAAQTTPPGDEGRWPLLITVRTGRCSSWSRDEIYGPDAR